jgi:drug/metabolite transporter (DMT)-like permease
MADKRFSAGIAFVALTAICYAANSSASVAAYGGGATPLSMLTFRAVFAVAALYVVLRAMGVSFAMERRDRNVSLALGILLAIYSFCLMEAFDRLPVALAVLTFYLYPLFMGFGAWAIGQDRLSRALIIGLVVAFIGLAIALDVTGDTLDPVGLALAAFGAAAFSTLAIIAAPIAARRGDSRQMVFYSHVTGALIVVVASLIAWDFPLPTTPTSWAAFFAAPMFYTVASVAFFAAVRRIGTVRTGLVMNLEPVAAMVFGFVFLGQVLTPVQLAGAALVIAAATAVKWDSARSRETTADTKEK